MSTATHSPRASRWTSLASHLGKRYPPTASTAAAAARAAGHLARLAWFVAGVPLLPFALAALARPDRWRLFALACCLLQAAVQKSDWDMELKLPSLAPPHATERNARTIN